jgi:medium-chain acyl-[acyl-carrier-protein] hydrolase
MRTLSEIDLRWLRGLGNRQETARLRIYTFHHAGGSASAYLWRKFFPADIEVCAVQLPGRESRFLEAPITSSDAVVDELAPAIASTVDLPFAFFGHSMGALIAFNVARRLDALGAPLPSELFLSAHRAPHLPDRDQIHELSDEEFLARLGDARLAALDPELREILLSIVRADITLCETYRYAPAAALPCPITAFGGRTDELVDVSELLAWEVHTSDSFDVRTFPGGHFYQRGAEQVLADHMRRKLRGVN